MHVGTQTDERILYKCAHAGWRHAHTNLEHTERSLFPFPVVQTAWQRAGVSFYGSVIIENDKYGLSKQRK